MISAIKVKIYAGRAKTQMLREGVKMHIEEVEA